MEKREGEMDCPGGRFGGRKKPNRGIGIVTSVDHG